MRSTTANDSAFRTINRAVRVNGGTRVRPLERLHLAAARLAPVCTVTLSGMQVSSPQVRTRSFTTQPPDLRRLRLGHVSFAVIGPLALLGTAWYPALIHRLVDSLRTSFPRSVTLIQLYFTSLAMAGSREDFHLQERVCWAHQQKVPGGNYHTGDLRINDRGFRLYTPPSNRAREHETQCDCQDTTGRGDKPESQRATAYHPHSA